MPEPETVALDLHLRRMPTFASSRGETWRIVFVDIREAATTYCPECAEGEFGEPDYVP